MKLKTARFGEIEFDEADIVIFDEGMPGFPDMHRFALLRQDDGAICYLQAIDIDEDDICFVLMDLHELKPDYSPTVDDELLTPLGETENYMVLNVAVIPVDIKDMTVNLKAPVVINWETKKGKQIICQNEDYHVRHKLFSAEGADD
ncbi:MAG: flagellar assembly protein FliW [Defluviitaleaceae bacterium]|nr:flagellar assembly protein FliW [Defluviitaleaceae bacterium]